MSEFKRKSFGGDRPRNGYPKRDFGRSNFNVPSLELFPATCASCGKQCQVPFRPNGKKPVYCKECFAANGGNDSAPRDFAPRPSFKMERKTDNGGNADLSDLKKQLNVISEKIDTLIVLMAE